MREKFRSFMASRYGQDDLNNALLILAVVCLILSFFIRRVFLPLATAVLVLTVFRMFSGNFDARRRENAWFQKHTTKIRPYITLWKSRLSKGGQYRYFLCPKCKKVLRVPRGKGHITIRCSCGESFKRKS